MGNKSLYLRELRNLVNIIYLNWILLNLKWMKQRWKFIPDRLENISDENEIAIPLWNDDQMFLYIHLRVRLTIGKHFFPGFFGFFGRQKAPVSSFDNQGNFMALKWPDDIFIGAAFQSFF